MRCNLRVVYNSNIHRYFPQYESDDRFVGHLYADAPEQPKPAGDVEADAARYRWFTAENKAAWDKVIDAARLAAQPAQGEGEK